MYLMMAAVFVIGYIFIALEHTFKIDKAASALLAGVLCWTGLVIGGADIFDPEIVTKGPEAIYHHVEHELGHHLIEIAQILFFLMGAMTVVELIDSYGGFSIITKKITTTNRVKLLWILSTITFFLSATLDNLTTAIVMAALLRKLMKDKEDRWFFAGILIIAANAGGAWSPIGDVTTIMLWIKGQVSASAVITLLIVPSMVVILVPLLILSFRLKGDITTPKFQAETNDGGAHDHSEAATGVSEFEKQLVLALGVGSLLFVPVFKNLTHLPPFMGILLGLGVLWVTTEFFNRRKDAAKKLSVVKVLGKIDMPSILFFLGILLAVGSLQSAGHLRQVAVFLDNNLPNIYVVNGIIGLLSSIVDNVPLVAGAMGMYDLCQYEQDHDFWLLLAFCAGTGGSALIIGSAAGVAIMGILKIDFVWYVKKVSAYAVIGYAAGLLVCYLFLGSPDGPLARGEVKPKQKCLEKTELKTDKPNPAGAH